jgi:cyclic beta-1,2-glucan synthetase
MAFAQLGDNRRAWELFSIINPINHARTSEQTDTYKVEPYVVAADVYAIPPHTGRGGWTWYTGSASWMYRLILESLLGMKQEKDKLQFTPCLPPEWEGFTLHYRHRETVYHITVQQFAANTDEVGSVSVDEVLQQDNCITLVDDHTEHWAVVRIAS